MEQRKVALVTGAGTGIGKAAALALMRHGFALVLNGRRKEPLEAVAAEGRSFGADVIAVPGDVADPAAVNALFAETVRTFGRLDVLFNNAGIFVPAVPLEDVSIEQWKASIPTSPARSCARKRPSAS